MSSYRDDLDAARARIETLEAKLRERDAALEAREAELREVQAEALRKGQHLPSVESDPAGRAGVIRAGIIALFVFGFFGVVTVIRTPPCSMIERPAAPAPPQPPERVHVIMDPQAAAAVEDNVDWGDAVNDPPLHPANQFDRRAATDAIRDAARLAASCKREEGPVGAGKVTLVFAPTGHVTKASVQDTPYQGTVVGGCV